MTRTINHLLKPLKKVLRMPSMPLKHDKLATAKRSTTSVVKSVNQDDNQNIETFSEAVNLMVLLSSASTNNQIATNRDSANAQHEQNNVECGD
jgi:hypothetical protein